MPRSCELRDHFDNDTVCDETINLRDINLQFANFAPPKILERLHISHPETGPSARNVSIRDVQQVADQVFGELDIDATLRHTVPGNLREATCVHLRRTDKIMQGPVETSEDEWRLLRRRALLYCAELIRQKDDLFFVVGDERDAVLAFEADLLSRGGSLVDVQANITRDYPRHAHAVVDLFRLSRCKRVLQVARYSSFSSTAAIIGGGELVNFMGQNWLLDRWVPLLHLSYS